MKTVTISHEGAGVMTISSEKHKIETEKEKTVIDTKEMYLDLWVVPKAKTVAEAIAGLDDVIKSEVLKFKRHPCRSNHGRRSQGKHLMGKGIEADDQDPATVDIVVFTVGKTVIVACVHGEGETAVRNASRCSTH